MGIREIKIGSGGCYLRPKCELHQRLRRIFSLLRDATPGITVKLPVVESGGRYDRVILGPRKLPRRQREMTKHSQRTLVAFALCLSALLPVVSSAQTSPNFVRPRAPNETPAPKVVFIGDWITYNWTSAFAANPNWVNQGTLDFFDGNSGGAAARFQADVVSLHPDIVHIMVGVVDEAQEDDALMALTTPDLMSNLSTMVQEAKAANIQVGPGMEPPAVSPENAVIAAYGARE